MTTADRASSSDAVVVGGGPAGAAAAITLARAGREVVLVDKATFPATSAAATGSPTGALAAARGARPRPDAVAVVAAGRRRRRPLAVGPPVELPAPPRPGTYAAVARRADLDARLRSTSPAPPGVKVHDGHACSSAPTEDGRVVLDVEVPASASHGRYAVGADGMWSPLRKPSAPPSRATSASGTPSASTSPASPPRPPRPVRVVRARPAARATPGRSRCPTGGPTSASASSRGGKVDRVQDMKRAVARPARPPAHPGGARPDADAEAPHKAWPIPARVDTAAADRRTGPVRRRCRRAPPTRMTGRGHRQALLDRDPRARAVSPRAAAPTDPVPRPPVRARRRQPPSSPTTACHAPGPRPTPPQRRPRLRSAIRRARAVDAPPLRPLALRGLSPGDRRHAVGAGIARRVQRRRRLPARAASVTQHSRRERAGNLGPIASH